MGAYTFSLPESENIFTMRKQVADRLSKKPNSCQGAMSFKTTEDNNESVFGESGVTSLRDSYKRLEVEANEKQMRNVYAQVLENYDELNRRVENMAVAKSKVLRYTPGSWVENVGGMTMSDYNVPKTTTLLLIGPKGSGKSSLINRISRAFEYDKFAPARAQVTFNSCSANGTFFLQEYMIPKSSNSFCLYDTRSFSFSSDLSENLEMIKRWMTIGVSHGEPVKSYGADTQYTQMVAELFNSPYLSFKDDKPAIAITHGDLLSLSERARVRVYLGELLGVHPCKHTFDVPDNCEQTTELTLVDLVRYALEHADKNLPCKGPTFKARLFNKDIIFRFYYTHNRLVLFLLFFASAMIGFML